MEVGQEKGLKQEVAFQEDWRVDKEELEEVGCKGSAPFESFSLGL